MLTKSIVDPAIINELTTYLQGEQLRPLLSMFKSYSHIHTGYWLDTAQFPEKNLRMEDCDYVESLRMRLLLPIFPIIRGYSLRCPCSLHRIQDPIKDMFHCLTCPVEGGPRMEIIGRHNRIRDALEILLRKIYTHNEVLQEQKPTEPLLPGQKVRQSDVVIRRHGAQPSTHYDVALVNPASDFYVNIKHSDTRDLAAAKNTEKRKIAHYVKSYGETFRTQIRPFVLEATGAFGPIASAILKKMVEPADQHEHADAKIVFARKHFLREVSVIVAKSTATLVYFARTHMRQDAPDNMVDYPIQADNLQYPPNMLEDVWPPMRLEGEEDDRLLDQGQDEEEDRALSSQELSQQVNGLLNNLGFSLSLAAIQEQLPFSERVEPNASSTSAEGAAAVVG